MPANPFPSGAQPQLDFRAKYKQWVLTIFDVAVQLPKFLEWIASSEIAPSVKDYFYGVENAPGQGTPHVHMGIWFNEQTRFTAFRKLLVRSQLSAWIAPMKGTWEEAEDYALKDPGHSPTSTFECQTGPIPSFRGSSSRKAKSQSESRKRKREAQAEVLSLALQGRRHQALARLDPTEAVRLAPSLAIAAQLIPSRSYAPICVWIYGPSGSGKTLLVQCLERSLGLKAHWADLKPDSKFWNGYSGQEMLVIDEARLSALPFAQFLKLVNSAPYQVEVKNYYVPVTSPMIVVTSPNSPYDFWPEAVTEPGHPWDIEQIRRRLNAVVRVTRDPEPRLRTTSPWKRSPSFNLPTALAHLAPQVPDLSSLSSDAPSPPEGWSAVSTSMTAPARLVLDADLTTELLLPKPLRLTLTPSSPHLDSDAPDPSDPSSSTLPDEPQHWQNQVRLPEGLDASLRDQIIQTLSEDVYFETYYCVEHRHVTTRIAQLLEQHYFSDLFF